MKTCIIHNIPLKPRVVGMGVYRGSGPALTEKECQKYVDEKHEFASSLNKTDTIYVCPICTFGVR